MARSLTPENAVDTWRHWDVSLGTRPVILRPLGGGRSNRSFLLDSNGMRMVLRLNGTESVLPGANRRSEHRIWQAAGAHGIAPPLLYVDDGFEFLVSAFIKTELPSQPGFNKAFINHAFDLLERCHQLDLEVPSIDYSGHIKKYWQIIESKTHPPHPGLNKQREPMQGLFEELTLSAGQTGLCHHDPVTENFVGSLERLYLIDWEYAANGLLIMDYAALAVEWGLDDRESVV